MYVQTVFVDTLWLHNVLEMFSLFIKFRFLWENGIPLKIKTQLPEHPQHYNSWSVPTFLILFKQLLVQPPFKKRAGTMHYIWGITILYDRFFIYKTVKSSQLKKIKKSNEKWYT